MFTNNHISSRCPKHIIRTGHTALEIHAAPGLEQAQQYGGIKSIQISLDILIHNSKNIVDKTNCKPQNINKTIQHQCHQRSSTSLKVDSLQGQKSILVIFGILLEKR